MGPDDPRVEVAQVAARLAAEGLLTGTSGNLSRREAATGRLYVTATGVPWSQMSSEAVAVLDAQGRRVAGPAPTSETPLHRRLYALRPDIGAIVHTHSHFATVFSVLRRPVEAVHYLLAFAGHRVEVAPYATYGTEALADRAAETLGEGRAVLLANHGLVAVGADLHEAARVAAAVEEVASLAWHAEALGRPVVLDDDEMARVAARFATYGKPLS